MTAELHTDGARASAWLEAEHDVLLRVAEHASDNGWDYHCANLYFALLHYLDWRGAWPRRDRARWAGRAVGSPA